MPRSGGGAYADGAQRGAPTAVQVADRFHLLQNLRDTLQRILDRNQTHLHKVQIAEAAAPVAGSTTRALASPSETAEPAPTAQLNTAPAATESKSERASGADPIATAASTAGSGAATPPAQLTSTQLKQQASRTRRQSRYGDMRRLQAEGASRRAIARQLHLGRHTVDRYLTADEFPERAQPAPKPSILNSYVPYLTQQLTAGHDNGVQLWREISQQGYHGSRSLVSRWVAHHRFLVPTVRQDYTVSQRRGRPPAPARIQSTESNQHLSARRAAWLVLRRPEDLADTERTALEQLREICADVRVAHPLAQEFAQLLRERQVEGLDPWLERAATSGVTELKRFAGGLQRDQAAVRAALSLSYSTGPVEGQINKLKLIKRSMYGRAKFDLLRRRTLASDTS